MEENPNKFDSITVDDNQFICDIKAIFSLLNKKPIKPPTFIKWLGIGL